MTINYTTLLGLTEPVTGTQSGTWGSDINTGLTDYVEAAIAGAQVISGSQTAVTLSVTTGSSSAPTTLSQAGSGATGSSQYQIIRCTGNPAGLLTITAPASDKTYVILNATSTSQAVKIVGAGPTTGVTIVSGERAFVAWNGSDFVKVGGAAGGANTQVQYNNNGVFGGSADLTWDGSTLATTGLTASGAVTLSATTQNIALGTSQVGGTWTAGGASQTGAITLDQSTKTHTLNIGTGATENALTKTINLGTAGVSGSTTAINIGSAVSGATTNVTLNGTVQPGVVISGSSSGDALRITQTGAGNALLVEDSANPDSSPFVVTAAGDVGIGTSSPSGFGTRLVVSGAASVYGDERKVVSIVDTTALAAGVGAGISFFGVSESSGGVSQFGSIKGIKENATAGNYAGALAFVTSNSTNVQTQRMLLDSSGNLGLGAAPTAGKNNANSTRITIAGTNAATNGGEFIAAGAAATIAISSGTTASYVWTQENYPMVFGTNGQERARITSGGDLQIANGNLVMSTSGKGIDFSATSSGSGTMTSELLSDYEEGTWTVQLQDASNNNATMEAGFTTATYVKIGRQVTVCGAIYTSSITGLSGAIRVSGLPFAIGNGEKFRSAGATTAEQGLNITSGQKLSVLIYSALSTKFGIWISNSATGGSEMTAAEWSNDGFCQFTLTYFTD